MFIIYKHTIKIHVSTIKQAKKDARGKKLINSA